MVPLRTVTNAPGRRIDVAESKQCVCRGVGAALERHPAAHARPWACGTTRARPSSDLRLLGKVATLDYAHGPAQHDVATRLHLSRFTVQRLLERARDVGIVRISIHPPVARQPRLEDAR